MGHDRRAESDWRQIQLQLLPNLVEKIDALASALDLSFTKAVTHILQVYFFSLRDSDQANKRIEQTEQAIHRAYYDDQINHHEAELLLGESEAAGLKVFKERQNRDYMNDLSEVEG